MKNFFYGKNKWKDCNLSNSDKQIYYIRLFVLAIFLLTLSDAACTAAGISLGVIGEGNPIWREAMYANPAWTAVAACVYTAGLLYLVYRFGARCRCTVPLLAGLCGVKVAVIGLHVGWIATL